MFLCLANLNPIRLLDEGTTQLGNWLLDFLPRLGGWLSGLTQLPAGWQILLTIGALFVLALSFSVMRKAFREAGALRRGVRDARVRSREARADLAVSDRRKAVAYLMLVIVALLGALLLIFVYQSVVNAGASN